MQTKGAEIVYYNHPTKGRHHYEVVCKDHFNLLKKLLRLKGIDFRVPHSQTQDFCGRCMELTL